MDNSPTNQLADTPSRRQTNAPTVQLADKPTRRQQTRRQTNSPTIKLAKKPTADKTERGMAIHIRQVVGVVGGGSFSR